MTTGTFHYIGTYQPCQEENTPIFALEQKIMEFCFSLCYTWFITGSYQNKEGKVDGR
jgi:hypothetical protein